MNERELFKKWLKAFDNGAVKIDRVTEIYMWQAWLASKNREGYKLVPVEPTNEMINVYRDESIAPISTLSIHGYKAMMGVVG